MTSRAMIASALILGSVTGAAEAAPAPAVTLEAASAQTLVAPVHYRCLVRRCGPYRCVWVNRCHRPYWW